MDGNASITKFGIGVLPVDIEFKDGQPVQVVMTQGKFQILDEIDDCARTGGSRARVGTRSGRSG